MLLPVRHALELAGYRRNRRDTRGHHSLYVVLAIYCKMFRITVPRPPALLRPGMHQRQFPEIAEEIRKYAFQIRI
jgi:hypothetical protein